MASRSRGSFGAVEVAQDRRAHLVLLEQESVVALGGRSSSVGRPEGTVIEAC